ncbi:hypothetical protein HID58_025749 [Brassica napus]|uniref:Uncharacterized protein n=1 Tax=Brassica napus TaxID=3708 RepID=A0ABQ8CM07_BRANA|nr:hypothetical protein HID58_025749 [Brassica napus]
MTQAMNLGLETDLVTLFESPKQTRQYKLYRIEKFLSKRKGCKFRSFLTFSIPIMKIPFPNEASPIKGIVITPTTTHEFGLSPGKDGFELGYSEEQPILRTEY